MLPWCWRRSGSWEKGRLRRSSPLLDRHDRNGRAQHDDAAMLHGGMLRGIEEEYGWETAEELWGRAEAGLELTQSGHTSDMWPD